MTRERVAVAGLVACAVVAFPVGTANAKRSTKSRVQRAVVKEVKSEHALLAYGDGRRVSARCSRLTRKKWKCSWSGSHSTGAGTRVEYFGKARATVERFAIDVRISDRDTRCYDPGARDLGIVGLCDPTSYTGDDG